MRKSSLSRKTPPLRQRKPIARKTRPKKVNWKRKAKNTERAYGIKTGKRAWIVDELVLVEWDPAKPYGSHATGRGLTTSISYVMIGGQFGLDPHFCVLGLTPPTLVQLDYYNEPTETAE